MTLKVFFFTIMECLCKWFVPQIFKLQTSVNYLKDLWLEVNALQFSGFFKNIFMIFLFIQLTCGCCKKKTQKNLNIDDYHFWQCARHTIWHPAVYFVHSNTVGKQVILRGEVLEREYSLWTYIGVVGSQCIFHKSLGLGISTSSIYLLQ